MIWSPGFLTTGSASPVSSDSSISSPSASTHTPSTTALSPGPISIRSSNTIFDVLTSPAVPSRRTVGRASPITARESRVVFARHSWTMPMPVLARITKPKRLSWIGATNSMISQSTPMIALNRVKTFARTISPIDRLLRSGTSLTCPRATRSATSAAVRPNAGVGKGTGCTGSSSAPASMCVMHSTVRADLRLHPPSDRKIRPGEERTRAVVVRPVAGRPVRPTRTRTRKPAPAPSPVPVPPPA